MRIRQNTVNMASIAVIVFTFFLAGCEPVYIESPSTPHQYPHPYSQPQPNPDDQCPDGHCPINQIPYATGPLNQLEQALRHTNYHGGSCAHAAMQDALIAQGLEWTANFWRKNHYGPAGVTDLRAICEQLDLRYTYTTSGDVGFLEWCSRTRRPACIFYFSSHAITFIGFYHGYAILIDNNHIEKEIVVPKAEFIRKWNAYGRANQQSGGVAFTVVYSPNPPPLVGRLCDLISEYRHISCI